MILSKKYTESMNKITVDDNLKKRILEKVAQVSKEEKENNNISIIKNSKVDKMWTKSMGLVAACCAFVICTSLNTKFPELFNKGNMNSNNENVENDNLETAHSSISEENNKTEINSDSEDTNINNQALLNDDNSIVKDEDVYLNNVGKENKRESNNTHINDNRQVAGSEKSTSTQTYEKTNTENNDGMDYIKSDNYKNEGINVDYEEDSSYNNETSAVTSNQQSENSSKDNVAETSCYGDEEKDYMVLSDRITREMPGNIQDDFKIPEALSNDNEYEISYTLLISYDVMEVGYKDKECGNGTLTISSKKNNNEDKSYSSSETVKTSNGDAVLKVSKDGKEKYADWKFDDKYYSLHSEGITDSEEIISIIESCR